MQKWEYLFVHFGFEARSWNVTFISDPELKEWAKDKSEHEISKHLGELGWELVSYAPFVGNYYGNTTIALAGTRMVFKRPIEGDKK